MFDSVEKKINALEYRIFNLEEKLKLSIQKNNNNYDLKVLQAGLTFLAVLGIGFLGLLLYRI